LERALGRLLDRRTDEAERVQSDPCENSSKAWSHGVSNFTAGTASTKPDGSIPSLDGRESSATSAFHPRFLQKSNRTEQRGKAGDQVNKMARAARGFVNGHDLLVCSRPATVIASSLV
jgi:hypothetical protein